MIAIITYSDFPNGSPGAIRYATFAQAYSDMGYRVAVLQKWSERDNGKVNVLNLYSRNRYSRYCLFGYRIITSLRRLGREERIESVIMGADVPAIHAIVIKWWCKCNKITCVFDVTEWYSKEQFNNWRIAISYWERELLNQFIIDKKARVIAISSYLYSYFKKKGCKATQIPIIYNPNAYNKSLEKRNNSSMLRIIYAGSHLKMDNIPLIVEALSVLPEEDRKRIQFAIYGLSKEQIESCIPLEVLEKLKGLLSIMGRRPNDEVMSAYSDVDFSIVLRDPLLRVNQAGFPSKVVESMRLGVPVICNYSSDLRDYLTHNDNSIVIDRLDVVELSEQLRKLAYMSQSNKDELGKNARQTILEKLDSKLFEEKFRYIIS